eukprot:6809484-Prymnesium_polylepis.1
MRLLLDGDLDSSYFSKWVERGMESVVEAGRRLLVEELKAKMEKGVKVLLGTDGSVEEVEKTLEDASIQTKTNYNGWMARLWRKRKSATVAPDNADKADAAMKAAVARAKGAEPDSLAALEGQCIAALHTLVSALHSASSALDHTEKKMLKPVKGAIGRLGWYAGGGGLTAFVKDTAEVLEAKAAEALKAEGSEGTAKSSAEPEEADKKPKHAAKSFEEYNTGVVGIDLETERDKRCACDSLQPVAPWVACRFTCGLTTALNRAAIADERFLTENLCLTFANSTKKIEGLANKKKEIEEAVSKKGFKGFGLKKESDRQCVCDPFVLLAPLVNASFRIRLMTLDLAAARR